MTPPEVPAKPEKKATAERPEVVAANSAARQEVIAATSDVVQNSNDELEKAYQEKFTSIEKETLDQDKAKIRGSSIADIRYASRLLVPRLNNESNVDKVANLKTETARRIKAYTDSYDSSEGWYSLQYKQYGSDKNGRSHEQFIGLGDILLDTDIQVIEVEKKINGQIQIIRGTRGESAKGRVCFKDDNGRYLSTYTGDRFRICKYPQNTPTKIAPDTPELKTYLEKLSKEDGLRREHKINFEAALNYSEDNIYEILESAGFGSGENIAKLTNREIFDRFQSMSGQELVQLRNVVKWEKLKFVFRSIGLDKVSQEDELTAELKTQVDGLKNDHPLVQAFGSKEKLVQAGLKVARAESLLRPFNWSSTGCMGFFHFTEKNTAHYNKNPINPKEAVAGLIELWQDNYKAGHKTADALIIAHNQGAKGAKENQSEGQRYLTQVQRQKEDFEEEDQDTEAIEAKKFLGQKLRIIAPISAEFEVSEKGTTLCSRTAYKNLNMLGVENPYSGNANIVEAIYDNYRNKIRGTNNYEIGEGLKSFNNNAQILAADIFVESGSEYGHRAAAYKGADEQWRILDPYRNNRSRTGVKFADYTGEIKFAVPLTAKGPYQENLIA